MRKQRRSSFFSYFSRAARRAWHEGKNFLLEQVVFAIALLLAATWLNIRMGYMQFSEGRHSLYAALLTYGCFTLLYLGYLILRCGWLVDEDRLEEIADRDKEVGRLGDELSAAHRECERLRDPVLDFEIGHSSVPQEVGTNQYAIHRRIAITNKSEAVARECELVLVSCSANIPGLTPDSALQVKDAPLETRMTDITRGGTKHFDLFLVFLTPGTDWPQSVRVWTPNKPEIPRHGKSECEIVLRLQGSNFSSRLWKGTVIAGEGDAEIVKLEPLSSPQPTQKKQ